MKTHLTQFVLSSIFQLYYLTFCFHFDLFFVSLFFFLTLEFFLNFANDISFNFITDFVCFAWFTVLMLTSFARYFHPKQFLLVSAFYGVCLQSSYFYEKFIRFFKFLNVYKPLKRSKREVDIGEDIILALEMWKQWFGPLVGWIHICALYIRMLTLVDVLSYVKLVSWHFSTEF